MQKLFLPDSTVFSLFKEILKTSGRNSLDGKRKGGIKKNAVLNAASLMPELISFTAAAVNDQQFLQYIKLPWGSLDSFIHKVKYLLNYYPKVIWKMDKEGDEEVLKFIAMKAEVKEMWILKGKYAELFIFTSTGRNQI